MDLSIRLRGATLKKEFAPLAKKRLRGATVPLGISVASPAKKKAPWRNCIAHWISAPAVVG